MSGTWWKAASTRLVRLLDVLLRLGEVLDSSLQIPLLILSFPDNLLLDLLDDFWMSRFRYRLLCGHGVECTFIMAFGEVPTFYDALRAGVHRGLTSLINVEPK